MTAARPGVMLTAMSGKVRPSKSASPAAARPSALVDTRIIYCGDCLDQLRKLPDRCVDPIYIDPPFDSNRNHELFFGDIRRLPGGAPWT